MTIKNADKFAILSCSETNTEFDISDDILELSDGFFYSQKVPIEITEFWSDALGSIQCEEISNSDFCLIVVKPSVEPDIVNQENNTLRGICQNYFDALLLTDTFSCGLAPKLITGSKQNDVMIIRTISSIDRPSSIEGAKKSILDINRLSEAYKIFLNLEKLLSANCYHGRIILALNCFHDAITENHIYERIRNYVRTIEAFIIPDQGCTGRKFKSRTELFIGSGYHDFFEDLYSLRSAIEHLHDPFKILEGNTYEEKYKNMFEICFKAEMIARYCLKHFIIHEDIWSSFMPNEAISTFWAKTPEERREIWGKELDFDELSKKFDPSNIKIK